MTRHCARPIVAGGCGGLLLWLAALLWLPCALVQAQPQVQTQGAAALRARHQALLGALANNPFGRPLVLESALAETTIQGDVYAVVAQPFAGVGNALEAMAPWCDILILHLNVKGCSSRGSGAESRLSLALGRKFDEPLSKAYRIDFSYRVVASRSDYLAVQLSADAGPLGTRDYRIALEVVALDAGRSFVHLSYSYGYDTMARLAMQAYLATLARDKVGFGIVARQPDGSPVYVGDLRGVVERNTMRYYLAIEAYLGALALPPAEQTERRLRAWFAATERHARQLHEIELEDYLAMKRNEIARQRAALPEAR